MTKRIAHTRQLSLFQAQEVQEQSRDSLNRRIVVRPRRSSGVGTQIFGGVIDDVDYNSDVRGDLWYGRPGSLGLSARMERDPHVAQSLTTKIAPLVAAMWDMDPHNNDPLHLEIADFVKYNLFEINDFDKALKYICRYMSDGFSMIEPTDDVRPISKERFPNHPGKGTGIVITGLHQIPAWTVKYFNQNKMNPSQLKSITQYIVGSDAEKSEFKTVSSKRFIRFTLAQEGANFAGISYLRKSWGAFKIKKTLEILDAMSHERHGIGTPVMKMAEESSESDFDTAELILSELRAHHKGYLALPHGYEMEWTTSGQGTNIGEAIERQNRDIAYNMGAGFMLLGLTGKTGSYALAQTQQGQYEIQLEGEARFIANTINLGSDGWSLIDRLVRLNYGDVAGLPRLVARNMPTRDWSRILPVLHNITVSGHITPDDKLEAFIRQVLNIPARDPETSRKVGGEAKEIDLEKEEKEQKEEQDDQEKDKK